MRWSPTYSPRFHRVSHTMRKTKTIRAAPPKSAKTKTKKSKKTPFADVGEILGGAIGSMFNMNLSGAGKWLGSGIGSIFGSGDYTVMGVPPKQNVLFNTAQVPKFSTSHSTNVIAHREYVRDIYGTTNFSNLNFAINPSNTTLFPWLSNLAGNYQQYKFHGLIFEFKPLITDFVTSGAPGVIVMATNYDINDPAYVSKQAMENSEFAVSVKPTLAMIHGVECASDETILPIKYVRDPSSSLDKSFYDLGLFQIATQGNPSGQLIGELWVSYLVEFYKPVLGTSVSSGVDQLHMARTNCTAAAPLGLIQLEVEGSIVATASSTVITITNLVPGAYYQIEVFWSGAATAGAWTRPGITYTNLTSANMFVFGGGGPYSGIMCPNSLVGVAQGSYTEVVQASTTSVPNYLITFNGAGVLPGATCSVDIFITQVDASFIG